MKIKQVFKKGSNPTQTFIETQNNYSQDNFAEQMINQYNHISEGDKKLLALIGNHCKTEAEKLALVEGLNTIKSPDASAEKKAEAKKGFSLFKDSLIKEGAKKVIDQIPDVTELPEMLAEFANGFGGAV